MSDPNSKDDDSLDLKVLIVDDLLQARRVIRKLLSKIGIESVTEAEGLEKALQSIRETPVDLVIADLNLKDGTGLELIQRIRSDEEIKSLPVIIITSDASRNDIIKGSDLGVSGFLLKPFNKDLLLEKIEEALGD